MPTGLLYVHNFVNLNCLLGAMLVSDVPNRLGEFLFCRIFLMSLTMVLQISDVVQSYRVLWTGLGAQLARDVPFSAICWGMLEPVRSHTQNNY